MWTKQTPIEDGWYFVRQWSWIHKCYWDVKPVKIRKWGNNEATVYNGDNSETLESYKDSFWFKVDLPPPPSLAKELS